MNISDDLYNPNYDFDQNRGELGTLPNLFTALISQSRFLGESLTGVMSGTSFGRFVLAPSDAENPAQAALQCGLLSPFGGFVERGFRAHDYQLGRRINAGGCARVSVCRLRLRSSLLVIGDPDRRSIVFNAQTAK